jgi:exopolyphosphatase / guanosine-5'-triphosphate,3'-diphosphate pyrophosphatase
MIALLFLMALIFPFSAASSDTGLVCAIDMGSNTFKLILGEMQEGNYVQHHFTKTRLGVGDDMSKTGVISPPKLKEIRQTLQKYLAICDSKGITTRAAVATPAFGEAKNRTMF